MRAILLAVLLASPTYAQECPRFDDLDAALRGSHQGRAIVLAVNEQGAAFLFYGNPDTETWSLVQVMGPCARILAHGVGYEEIPAFPGEES